MLAVLLVIALFAFWLVVGLAVLRLLDPERDGLSAMLLAPAVGSAATLIPVFVLNRWGLPVATAGPIATAVLAIVTGGVLWRTRRREPTVPWLAYLPFALVILLALWRTGRPLSEFGFDWVSFCNDDMANYCLASERFLRHGFFDPPDWPAYLAGRDYPQGYWFLHVAMHIRPGSDLTIAWVLSLTGLAADQAFMPAIVVMYLALVSATAALVVQAGGARRLTAVVAAALLAASPLTTLGVVYQLIGQVFGLALATATAACVFRTPPALTRAALMRYGALAGLLVAALLVVYPEVCPFLGLAFAIYLVARAARRELAWRPLAAVIGVGAVAAVAVLGTYAFTSMLFLLEQAAGSTKYLAEQRALFPFYLLPSGLANLWGFSGLTEVVPDDRMDKLVVAGAVLLVVAVVAAAWGAWRAEPVACLCAAMFVAAAALVVQGGGFGLYKVSMFVQPFMLGSLVVWWASLLPDRAADRLAGWLAARTGRAGHGPAPASAAPAGRWRRAVRRAWASRQTAAAAVARAVWLAPFAWLAYASHATQGGYVAASRGVGSSFVEVPQASIGRVNHEFREALAAHPGASVLSDTSNIVTSKLQALHARGRPLAFPGSPGMSGVVMLQRSNSRWYGYGRQLIDEMLGLFTTCSFDLRGTGTTAARRPATAGDTNLLRFNAVGLPAGGADVVAVSTGRQSVLNRRHYPPTSPGSFLLVPADQVANHLVFMNSDRGRNYYQASDAIGLFQLEQDPLFVPGETFAGLGRHLLFWVLNPGERVRVGVTITRSFAGDGDNRLPPAVAIGDRRVSLGLVGRGSARVYSEAVAPQVLAGRPFVALDMVVEGHPFPERRKGLMRLFGKDVRLDRRTLVGFARDLSAVSPAQYAAFDPPAVVRAFPGDINNPDLEYSGCYEDGWVSEHSFFALAQPPGASRLSVKVEVPLVDRNDFTTELVLKVDGAEVGRRTLAPGAHAVAADVPEVPPSDAGRARRRVELVFSDHQKLHDPDNRPAAGLLREVGFVAPAPPPAAVAAP